MLNFERAIQSRQQRGARELQPAVGASILVATLGLLLLMAFGLGLSAIEPRLSAGLGLIMLFASYWVGYRYAPLSVVVSLPFLYLRLTELVSGISVDQGVALREVGTFSEPSTAYYVVSMMYAVWPLVAINIPAFRINAIPADREDRPAVRAALWVCMIYAGFIYINYAIYGVPLFNPHGKYVFYNSIDSQILNVLIRYRMPMALIVGYLCAMRINPMWKGTLLLTYLLLFVLGGDKLTAPAMAICMIAMGYYSVVGANRLFLARNLSFLGLGLLLFVSVYFFARLAISGSADVAWASIWARFPAQAQVWYLAYTSSPEPFQIDFNHAYTEFLSILPGGDNFTNTSKLGQWYVLFHYGASDVIRKLSSSNGSFIMILYGYVLTAYGSVPTFLFNIGYLLYVIFVQVLLVKALRVGNFVSIGCFGFIFALQVTANISGNISSMVGTNIYLPMIVGLLSMSPFLKRRGVGAA